MFIFSIPELVLKLQIYEAEANPPVSTIEASKNYLALVQFIAQ